jgi:hypothetical protein
MSEWDTFALNEPAYYDIYQLFITFDILCYNASSGKRISDFEWLGQGPVVGSNIQLYTCLFLNQDPVSCNYLAI